MSSHRLAGGVKQFFMKTGSEVKTGDFKGEGFKSLAQGRAWPRMRWKCQADGE